MLEKYHRNEEEARGNREEGQLRTEEEERNDEEVRKELRAIIEAEKVRLRIEEEGRKEGLKRKIRLNEIGKEQVRCEKEEADVVEDGDSEGERIAIFDGEREPSSSPPRYYSTGEVFLFREALVATEAPEDRKEVLPVIFREVLGSHESKMEGDLRFLQLRAEVRNKVEDARSRDEVCNICRLIEKNMKEYRDHIMKKCNKKLMELTNVGLISSGKHSGSYAGVKHAHRRFFGYYLVEFRRYRDGWEISRELSIKGVATLLLMAERLIRIHNKFC